MESSYFRIVSAAARLCETENEFWGLLNDALQCLTLDVYEGRCGDCINCRLIRILTKGRDDYESEIAGNAKDTDIGNSQYCKSAVSG